MLHVPLQDADKYTQAYVCIDTKLWCLVLVNECPGKYYTIGRCCNWINENPELGWASLQCTLIIFTSHAVSCAAMKHKRNGSMLVKVIDTAHSLKLLLCSLHICTAQQSCNGINSYPKGRSYATCSRHKAVVDLKNNCISSNIHDPNVVPYPCQHVGSTWYVKANNFCIGDNVQVKHAKHVQIYGWAEKHDIPHMLLHLD